MTDVRGARIVRLIKDPLVGGDLLLAGIGLAAEYDFGLRWGGPTINDMADLLWSTHHYEPHWKIRDVFRQDIRTYKPVLPTTRHCTGPMLRRDGVCGRPATVTSVRVDWSTGESRYIGGCNRHAQWFHATHRENQAAKPDVVPIPAANHGGALRVHFPRLDWPAFWRRLDPQWVEHPEAHAWPKPDLQLVLGDAGDNPDSGRPLLSVVPLDGRQ